MDKRLTDEVTQHQAILSAAVSLMRIAESLKGIDRSLDKLLHLLKNKL